MKVIYIYIYIYILKTALKSVCILRYFKIQKRNPFFRSRLIREKYYDRQAVESF